MGDRLDREVAELKRLRAVAIFQFRVNFQQHGFDVADYDDDEVSHAILAEPAAGASPGKETFARAFARLHARSGVGQRGMTTQQRD